MKGDVKYVACVGSTGSVVRDFTTKEVVVGSYRHTQTVGGIPLSWKCGSLVLNGIVKLVEDEFDNNGTMVSFLRMEGLADSAASVTKVTGALAEVAAAGW